MGRGASRGFPGRAAARSHRTFAAAALPLIALTLAALGSGDPLAAKPKPKPQTRPNVIVIVTDDMPRSFLQQSTVPNTIELLANQGTTFTNSVVTTPLCCPSRASYLSGQYGHNNGVLANKPGYADLRNKRSTLPFWLKRAGYYTAHVGRYLNGYKNSGGEKPAPGWDGWYTALEPRNYYDYNLAVNGDSIHYGKKPKHYLTRVLNSRVAKVIRQRAPGGRPFYIQLDHYAPHDEWRDSGGACGASAIPGPGDLSPFASQPLPTPPNFNEEDMNDKPPFLYALEPVDEFALSDIEREWRCRMASMRAVDRGVQKIVSTLTAKGELDNTMIAFTSDNGFYHGEHRIPFEKYLPYEEGIHVPLLVRFPTSVGAVPAVDHVVANIDLTATVLDIAGASPCVGRQGTGCRVLDGRSFLPLAQGQSPDWALDREIVIELDRRFGGPGLPFRPCFYEGIRTATHSYIEYLSLPGADGLCREARQVELYDVEADPYQLQNMFPAKPGTAERVLYDYLTDRLAVLNDCSGIEGRDPPPASGHYCD
jgi:N-acetylglucosamine-6-sulfatase